MLRILIPVAQPGSKLGRPFQIYLRAAIEAAADQFARRPLPDLYRSHVKYAREPWAGQGIEEFADPYTVWQRGWADCDDAVIFRGGQLLAAGLPCHARILRDRRTNKYHTQLSRDFAGLEDMRAALRPRGLERLCDLPWVRRTQFIEDPALAISDLGKQWLFRKKHSFSQLRQVA